MSCETKIFIKAFPVDVALIYHNEMLYDQNIDLVFFYFRHKIAQ